MIIFITLNGRSDLFTKQFRIFKNESEYAFLNRRNNRVTFYLYWWFISNIFWQFQLKSNQAVFSCIFFSFFVFFVGTAFWTDRQFSRESCLNRRISNRSPLEIVGRSNVIYIQCMPLSLYSFDRRLHHPRIWCTHNNSHKFSISGVRRAGRGGRLSPNYQFYTIEIL